MSSFISLQAETYWRCRSPASGIRDLTCGHSELPVVVSACKQPRTVCVSTACRHKYVEEQMEKRLGVKKKDPRQQGPLDPEQALYQTPDDLRVGPNHPPVPHTPRESHVFYPDGTGAWRAAMLAGARRAAWSAAGSAAVCRQLTAGCSPCNWLLQWAVARRETSCQMEMRPLGPCLT